MWDSAPWKDELLRAHARLARYRQQRRWVPASYARVELDVVNGFYAIRKLIEADTKLTTSLADSDLPVRVYPPSADRRADRMNWHHLDKIFDMENPREERRPLRFICNQLVHSFIFTVLQGEDNGLMAVLVASDRQRLDGLVQIGIEEVLRVFELVGTDYPVGSEGHRDERGDWHFVNYGVYDTIIGNKIPGLPE